ncbi:hypothetical protein BJF85_05615 [Saccharomonospora sp. CUA-673]|uniref:hypothetical protein n=1 Tax=Saccharomonospora sp. CUA-673 TaxID=1904969 RepID=UPI0009696A59|nr:hypothetical protein [Saccharomonospora sp. CUA-673]OLT40623.1 hypothetical protein BJF85_05615 [Saccharomonospora sp. CUA-673]
MPLTAAHWFYLAGVIVILITMIARKNIIVPALVATFLTAFVFSGSLITGITSIFNASLVAAANLFNIFLIIALVTAMLHSLQVIGADRKMVAPFRRVMRNGHMAFWVLALVMFFMSLFFWPTPVVPLLGAVLFPVAIRAGMRPIAVGAVVATAGQGMALSSDYVMRVAPGLSAEAGGLSANEVTDKALVLALVTGGVALLLTYAIEMRKMRTPSPQLLADWEGKGQVVGVEAGGAVGSREAGSTGSGERAGAQVRAGSAGSTGAGDDGGGTTTVVAERAGGSGDEPDPDDAASSNPKASTFFAMLVPALYLSLIVYLIVAKVSPSVPDLEAGEAAGLVGGVAAFVVILAALVGEGRGFLESSATHVVNGLVFAFKAMGIVIPIAGFFFLGNGEFAAEILGKDDVGEGLLFDMVATVQQHVPDSPLIAAFAILLVGLVAGMDGSGFSGLPLTGALAGSFGAGSGMNPETLAAIGQMGNIWAGGGTLVAWSSLIAVAGFARVPVLDLARKLFLPVMAGLFVSTLVAVIFLG